MTETIKWNKGEVFEGSLWSECGRFEIRKLGKLTDFLLLDYVKGETCNVKPTSQHRCKLLAEDILKEESR